VIATNRLQFGIFDSENYRLLGSGGMSHISTLSYDGSLWDAIVAAPSTGVNLNARSGLVSKIISKETGGILLRSMTNRNNFCCLVPPMNDSPRKIAGVIKKALRLAPSESLEQIEEVN
jgi:hypothetical protein